MQRLKGESKLPKPLRIGIAGCGFIAQQDYFPVLVRPEIKEKVDVVAVCDLTPGRAESSRETFGFAAAYTDYSEMLRSERLDLVAILTPINAHFAQALEALRAGVNVYVQKTMAASTAEALELNREAEERELIVAPSPGQMVDHWHQEAKRILTQGLIGKVVFARCQGPHPGHEAQDLGGVDPSWYYAPGGGPMMDVAVYPLTSLVGLIGPALRVSAMSGIVVPERSWGGKNIPISMDDNTALLLDFGSSVFATVSGNFVTRRWNTPQVELVGTRGVLNLGGWMLPATPLEYYSENEHDGFQASWTKPVPPLDSPQSQPMSHTVRDLLHVVECVSSGATPAMSGEQAAHVIEIIEKGYVSAREGTVQHLETTFNL